MATQTKTSFGIRGFRHPQVIGAVILAVLLVVIAVLPVFAGFQAQQTYPVGSKPNRMVMADVNGDSRPDIVVVNTNANNVGILLGNADGTFGAPVTYATGTAPKSVAVGAFDNNTSPDLAVTDGTNTVGVLLNNGNGTFQARVPYTTATSPYGIATGDLNGDTELDLVVGAVGNISVLLGNGDGTFQTKVDYTGNQTAFSVVLADFDKDNDLDAITANGNGSYSRFLGTGTGTFGAQTIFSTGSGLRGMAVGDFNADGNPDFVATDTVEGKVNIQRGNGNGTFGGFNFPAGDAPEGVAVGDINGDGKQDLVVTSTGGTTVNVLLGKGDSTFQPFQPITVGSHPSAVGIAELNGDGLLDIIAANRDSDTMSVLLGTINSTIQFSGATVNVSESATVANLTLTRTGDLMGAASVVVKKANGATATSGDDFTWPGDQTVTWADGDGDPKTVAVALFPDVRDEPNETIPFTVSLPTTATWATLGAQTTTTLTIADDDPTPVVSVANTNVQEGNSGTSTLSFQASLTGLSDSAVTVQYATSNGTATAGSDYTARSGTLTFDPGTDSQTVAVTVNGDRAQEEHETLTLTLSNPTNATLGTAVATGTIFNDDLPLPRISPLGDISVIETNSGAFSVGFGVVLQSASADTVTVQYATSNGAATAGSDYTAKSGTLTLDPGATFGQIFVSIIGDTVPEADETFTVTLSNPVGASLGPVTTATGTINNDDGAAACGFRPPVTTSTSTSGGALQAHIGSTQLNNGAPNPIQQITLGTFQNATVTLNGQAVTSGQTVTLPANTLTADLTVRRAVAGQPTTVPLTVVDGCGEWKTFLGGGAAAGF